MGLSAKFVQAQLNFLQPLMEQPDLESARKGHARIQEILQYLHGSEVIVKHHDFPTCRGAWVLPRGKHRQGVILYLHGGGYACGDLEDALGFASTLAVECSCQVFCLAYRLAPEHPYPAALEDAMTAYYGSRLDVQADTYSLK
jgi:acetyl esterase/lipase